MNVKNFLICENGMHVSIDFDLTPHLLVSGPTGSHKTTAMKFLIGKLCLQNPNIEFEFADFKNWGDWDFAGLELRDMNDVIDDACMVLQTRQGWHQAYYDPYVFVLDEYPSFLLSLEKNDLKKYQSAVARLLMLGRAYNLHVVILAQRPDASLFVHGARDNFGFRLALGGLSGEAKRMIFPNDVLPPEWLNNKPGVGLLYREGLGVRRVKLPRFDLQKLDDFLKTYFK
ncbi:hypothetical protein ACLUW2_09740 [Limosilactobacillus balticus]|uniref:hypothetical protein n=1 Tax=Limosilactobacillus balticus TaxID=2759747 RepID=UPI003991EF30